MRWIWFAAWAVSAIAYSADSTPLDELFHDVEHEALLRQTQIDMAAPEPAGFTALGLAPFQAAQTLSPAVLSFAAVQTFDGSHLPRTTLAADISSLTLWRQRPWRLSDYKGHHDHRVITRAQLSLAVSKGEGDHDPSLRVAPALRVVLHQQRDPRVHRGAGSLEDCFDRNIELPAGRRAAMNDLGQRLDKVERELDGPVDPDTGEETEQEWQSLESQWDDAVEEYRRALQEAVGEGMASCRKDPALAAYAWNSSGLVLGAAPTLLAEDGQIGNLVLHGYSTWFAASYGFDVGGTQRDWVAPYFARHAQVIGQYTYRHDQRLPNPDEDEAFVDADQHELALRLRAGNAPLNASLELVLARDDFDDGSRDAYSRASLGADLRLRFGVWISGSLGRTFSRERIPDQTSLRVSVQWSPY